MREIDFNGVKVQLFPDLSWLMLQQRWALEPILATLRSHSIPYRWGLQFSLSARKNGKTSIIQIPEDTRAFCAEFNIGGGCEVST